MIPNSLPAAFAEAEVDRLAILMAKAAIRAAQASSDSAKAEFGPKTTINGSVGRRATGPTKSQTDGFNGSLGFQITVLIYAGRRHRGEYSQGQYRADQVRGRRHSPYD
ncbi:MAG: TolC family protein [Candidatus Devosia symbiotica]|nr:TolC family protein [Candidatus Devosia symbiotica]